MYKTVLLGGLTVSTFLFSSINTALAGWSCDHSTNLFPGTWLTGYKLCISGGGLFEPWNFILLNYIPSIIVSLIILGTYSRYRKRHNKPHLGTLIYGAIFTLLFLFLAELLGPLIIIGFLE